MVHQEIFSYLHLLSLVIAWKTQATEEIAILVNPVNFSI